MKRVFIVFLLSIVLLFGDNTIKVVKADYGYRYPWDGSPKLNMTNAHFHNAGYDY